MEPVFELTIHIVHILPTDKWQWSMKFGSPEWPIASITGEENSLIETMEQIRRIIRWGKASTDEKDSSDPGEL